MLPAVEKPVLRPWTVRSRTRRAVSDISRSAESVWSSQLFASVMLRVCCAAAVWSARICIALLVPVGESDGALIRRPDVSCCCSLPTASRLRFRPFRLVSATARWVILIQVTAPRGRCG